MAGLHDDAFGKCAIDLLQASDGVTAGVSLQPEICKIVGDVALLPSGNNGDVRFAGLPEADKVDLFLKMLDASLDLSMYQMGGARKWGPQMVPHLPQRVQKQAADLLRRAENGQ